VTQYTTIWTDEQVANLNAYQKDRRFHPFTCPGDNTHCQNQRDLIATREGWVCACGEYRQNWAHDFMLAPLPPPSAGLARILDYTPTPEGKD